MRGLGASTHCSSVSAALCSHVPCALMVCESWAHCQVTALAQSPVRLLTGHWFVCPLLCGSGHKWPKEKALVKRGLEGTRVILHSW